MLSSNKCSDEYEEVITCGFIRFKINSKFVLDDLTNLCVQYLKTDTRDRWNPSEAERGDNLINCEGTLKIDKTVFRKKWRIECPLWSLYSPLTIGLLPQRKYDRNLKDGFGFSFGSRADGDGRFTHNGKSVMSYLPSPKSGDCIVIQYRTIYDEGYIRGELSFGINECDPMVIATAHLAIDQNQSYILAVWSSTNMRKPLMPKILQ